MFIRFYTTAETEQKALYVLDEILMPITQFILSREIGKVEPYWKIKGDLVVEAKLTFKETFGVSQRDEFLNGISDSWQFFGEPIDEALTSNNMTSNIKYAINFINVFYE